MYFSFRRSKLANSNGDIETGNPLYNAYEKTGTYGNLDQRASVENSYLYPCTNGVVENENMGYYHGNRSDNILSTGIDHPENSNYYESLIQTKTNEHASPIRQDDSNADNYAMIDDE